MEDSSTVRRYIVDTLEHAPDLVVVGEAADGGAAIQLCERLRPDVITMDLVLPGMSGYDATKYIMAHRPTPILVVSSSMNRREVFRTYDALAAGAIDVLEKPGVGFPEESWREDLLVRVRMISRVPVITHLDGKRMSQGMVSQRPTQVARRSPHEVRPRLVAIGASTGGPAAVLTILRSLPREFRLPVLLVLHLSREFGVALADWLSEQVSIPVCYAGDGMDLPPPGNATVLMAPPDRHLVVEGDRLWLSDAPERNHCRPSVDVLFESLARSVGSRVIACLLTGMGRDGAVGLAEIRRVGGITLVQDEATSVVFGMPGEAIRLGAAEHVVPLYRLGSSIAALAGPQGEQECRP